MGRADPDRPGRPSATAGTLDSGDQVPAASGEIPRQRGGEPAGDTGARTSRVRSAASPAWRAATGSRVLRGAARNPFARHVGLLLRFIAAGAAATIPLAGNL